ncbi:MAG TPA: cysteine desulfurase [Candidatus Methanomethylophilaceae archaeon]|nr:cysteine desulfurase [Candidatus Methanomethylophilaceae archaeon]
MDMESLRNDFPTLRKNEGVYLDSACQSLRPNQVIQAVTGYYEEISSCGGRSVHGPGSKISIIIDETREALARFFNTDDPDCYSFCRNTTEALNTIAFGLSLKKNDTVVTTDSEHNSNHVPWVVLSEEKGVKRRYAKTTDEGEFDEEVFKECIDSSVKAVSIQHASNVTGCTMPVREITEIARDAGAIVIIDGAQAAPHMKVDLGKIDPDFYCMSIHKMLGPSGMGVMYGKSDRLKELRPLIYGGGTISMTTHDSFSLAPHPEKFEAGLQDYAGIAGTKAAIEYLTKVGMKNVETRDRDLMRRMVSGTEDIKGLKLFGPANPDRRGSVFSFNVDGMSPHDIAVILDEMDRIMIRSGLHCAHPLFEGKKIEGSARASVYLYNNHEDIDRFCNTLRKAADTFGG